jgi:hypothetical protein
MADPIPVTDAIRSFFEIELDDQKLQLRFRYSDRDTEPGWYMDLKGVSFETEVSGIAVVGGVNLLKGLAIPELGEMYLVDVNGEFQDPDEENFGDRYLLYYVSKGEL